jgi:hypothetical protein
LFWPMKMLIVVQGAKPLGQLPAPQFTVFFWFDAELFLGDADGSPGVTMRLDGVFDFPLRLGAIGQECRNVVRNAAASAWAERFVAFSNSRGSPFNLAAHATRCAEKS